MNPNLRLILITAGIAALAAAYTAAVFPSLPAQIPVHFDAAGRPDRYEAKETGAWLTLWVIIGMGVLFAILPAISPKSKPIDSFRRTYDIIAIGSLLFMAAIHVVVLNAAKGDALSPTVLGIIICMMLGFLGNFLGKVTPNYFVGIRTPWTLESPEVWERTHRFAATTSVIASVLGILIILATGNAAIGILGATSALMLSIPYSYFLYVKLKKAPNPTA